MNPYAQLYSELDALDELALPFAEVNEAQTYEPLPDLDLEEGLVQVIQAGLSDGQTIVVDLLDSLTDYLTDKGYSQATDAILDVADLAGVEW
jgi:hypothetical protein